ncbi:hypothetical protein ScPMuIL_012904 [Solemya velum]
MGWKIWISAAILVLVALAKNSDGCDDPDWVGLGDDVCPHCYFFSHDHVQFDQAKARCESKGGYLVEIEGQPENDAIHDHILAMGRNEAFWIALKLNHDIDEFTWISEPSVLPSYYNWAYREPDSRHLHEDCVQMQNNNGQWNDVPCSKTTPYICEKGASHQQCEDAWGPEWVTLNNRCYHFSKKDTNYIKAMKYCESLDGALVIINDEEENDMLWGIISGMSKNRWLGLNVDHTVEPPTLWWVPDPLLPVTYTNFPDGEPNNWDGQNENCVQMRKQTGLWNDMPCSKTQKCICERDPPPCL